MESSAVSWFIQTAEGKVTICSVAHPEMHAGNEPSGTLELSGALMRTGSCTPGRGASCVAGARLGIATSRPSPGTPSRHSAEFLSVPKQPERGQCHRHFEPPRSAVGRVLPHSGHTGKLGEQGKMGHNGTGNRCV